MEGTIQAAATVIKYLGAAIIEAKCGELVEKARGAEEAADAAGVDRACLSEAARELEAAGEEGRLQAVVNLRDASAALEGSLEGAARDQLHALRGAASNLARSCAEYRESAMSMGDVLHTKEEGADGGDVLHTKEEGADGGARGSWWWSLWRRCQHQQGVRDDLPAAGVGAEEAVDRADVAISVNMLRADVEISVDILSTGMPQLRESGVKLVAQARGVADAANGARVPCGQLLSAADAFEHAFEQAGDLAALLNCLGALSTAATAVEAAESAPLKAVRDRAAHLARACQELKNAADAMSRVQRGAAQLRERRVAGAWWACLWQRRRRLGEMGDGAAAAPGRVQPAFGQGGEMSDMASFALSGSLVLITCLGPDTVTARVKIFPEILRYCIHAALCLWWILQTAGMTFSAFAVSRRERLCMQIIDHIGMLAVNGFIIAFAYLALDIHHKFNLGFWVVLASLIHIFSFMMVRRRSNPNR